MWNLALNVGLRHATDKYIAVGSRDSISNLQTNEISTQREALASYGVSDKSERREAA